MDRLQSSRLIMVGSLPLERPEDVFAWVTQSGLASHMPFLPDGEPHERSYWITGQGYRCFHGHPEIETIKRPAPVGGIENWKPTKGLLDQWSFRVKEGVDRVHFGDPGWRLGYARDALDSFFVFNTMRERGLLPANIRFQVCLPMPISTCLIMFRDSLDDVEKVLPSYTEALTKEIASIAKRIPPSELAFQWDSTREANSLADPLWASMTQKTIAEVSAAVPADALLGFHLCHGSNLPNAFFARAHDNLSEIVDAANAILRLSSRRVDFLHFPVIDHAQSSYFESLRGLNRGDVRWFLGCIHAMSDQEDFRRRLEYAGQYIPDFGLGAPCGFGRFDSGRVTQIARDHLRALELLDEVRGHKAA
jgi:hypothetical protein